MGTQFHMDTGGDASTQAAPTGDLPEFCIYCGLEFHIHECRDLNEGDDVVDWDAVILPVTEEQA